MSEASSPAKAVSASDVVGRVEREIGLVVSMRAEAQRLLDEAAALELASREAAKRDLGDRMGEMAFELASTTPSVEPIQLPAASVDPVPAASRPPVDGAPAPAPTPAQFADAGPQRIHGVEVPSGRLPEAEGIVAEAKAFSAQGRKANPYSSDRGKNAWRKSLFAAALRELSRPTSAEEGQPSPDAVVAIMTPKPEQVTKVSPAPISEAEHSTAKPESVRGPVAVGGDAVVEEEPDADRREVRSGDPPTSLEVDDAEPEPIVGGVRPDETARVEGYGPRHGGRLIGVSYPIVNRRSVGGMKLPKPERLDEIVPRAPGPFPPAATSPPPRPPNASSGAGLRPPPFMRN